MITLCDHCQNNLGVKGFCNIASIEKPCNVLSGSPCEPCRKLAELEAQISEVKALLDILQRRRHPIQKERNRIHDPLIHQVPSEVASHIFAFCLPSPSDASRLGAKAPLTLGAVCTTWRTVVWETPRLWTSMTMLLHPSKAATLPPLIEEWLARSGQLPLSICICYDDKKDKTLTPEAYSVGMWGELLDLIKKTSNRWRALDLRIPQLLIEHMSHSSREGGTNQSIRSSEETTLLEELRVEAPHDVFALRPFSPINPNVIPHPRVVKLSYIPFGSISISWDNVTHFEGRFLRSEECLELLQLAHRLVSCKFTVYAPDTSFDSRPSVPFTHHHLRSLCHRSRHRFQCDFQYMNNLTLPSLEELILNSTKLISSTDLVSLFNRSACSLKRLAIEKAQIPIDDLTSILRAVPTLEQLTLSPYYLDKDFLDQFAQAARHDGQLDRILLPRLERFAYSGIVTNALWESWLLLARAIFLHDDARPASGTQRSRRPQRSIRLTVSGETYDEYISKDTVHALLDLQHDLGITCHIYDKSRNSDLLQKSMVHHGIEHGEVED